MRIKDWSSDVCSSDLGGGKEVGVRRDQRGPALFDAAIAAQHRGYGQQIAVRRAVARFDGKLGGVADQCGDRRGDRKSVVWGKCVSVGVEPGGRRITKKKKKQERVHELEKQQYR